MSNTFAQLKRNRQSQFEKLNDQLQKLNSPVEKKEDNRFWKPDVDKAGNGLAVIRFLPAPNGEDLPYVRIWDHGFQGTGGWYIEKSLTTLGQKDPVSEYNSKLWATGTKEAQAQVRKQKRRLYFISNIYVVKDPSHPENEGKVFLFQYGKKIFDKLNMVMNPEFEDETPINPFDMWEGANFKLKIRNVEGYRNYDSSTFESPGPLLEDDEELERIWNSEHSLNTFIDPKEFKSYEELEAKLHKVLGLDGSAPKPQTTVESSNPWDEEETTQAAPPKQKSKPAPKLAEALAIGEEDDEDLEMFKKLLDD